MRQALFVIFLLFSTPNIAKIYHWTDQQGAQHFSQTPPRDKSILSEKIHIKKHRHEAQQAKESLQESANAIAKSNAERKAANDEIKQQIKHQRLMANNCQQAKQSLSALTLSGNRKYKDASGNYQRLDEKAKNKQRKRLNTLIKENCR